MGIQEITYNPCIVRNRRIREIEVKLIPLASPEELTHGYFLYGYTRKGRYFEVQGYPSFLEVKLYENRESDEPIAETEIELTGNDDVDRVKLADTLYTIIEEDNNDMITKVSIGG